MRGVYTFAEHGYDALCVFIHHSEQGIIFSQCLFCLAVRNIIYSTYCTVQYILYSVYIYMYILYIHLHRESKLMFKLYCADTETILPVQKTI